jgi:TonB family protein
MPMSPVVAKETPQPVKQPIEFKPPPKLPVIVPRQITVTEPPAPIPQPRQEMAKIDLPRIEPAAIPRPAPIIKTGGFGNPDGARPSVTAAANGPTAPQLGSFDLPPGSSKGLGRGAGQVALGRFGEAAAGPGQEGNGRGSVRSAGFGDAAAGSGAGSQGNSRGSVRAAGFGGPETAPAVSHAALPAAPAESAVEITFKPKPAYTAEARAKKIEGEVLLEVLFLATGRIQVLRVMRGLGFGLDENARDAASQIRFQPGTRDGAAVDIKATVRIVFELS